MTKRLRKVRSWDESEADRIVRELENLPGIIMYGASRKKAIESIASSLRNAAQRNAVSKTA